MQPAGAADRDRVPGVLLAGRQDAGGVGARRHTHDRAEVAVVARVLEQDRRRVAALDHAGGGEGGPPRDRGHAGVVGIGAELAVDVFGDRRGQLAQPRPHVGRQLVSEPLELGGLAGQHRLDLAVESQRVLERVKPLEDGELAIATGGSVALHEGFAHRPIMTRSRANRRGDRDRRPSLA